VSGPEAVHIRVATKARPNMDKSSPLDREFFKSFLEVNSSDSWLMLLDSGLWITTILSDQIQFVACTAAMIL
jgi:hypothetical protein